MQRKGILYVISAPSGAGKSTLCRELLDIFPELRHSVSFTTRNPRPGEIDGKDYFFVSREEFLRMVAEDGFAEWAEVHGNLYGTAIKPCGRAVTQGLISCLTSIARGRRNSRLSRWQGLISSSSHQGTASL